MRIYEITNPEDQLALLKAIMDNTWATISREKQIKRPIANNITKLPLAEPSKSKATPKPKKAPMAAAPKPLSKAKPLAPTPAQIKTQQEKSQQDYAKVVQKTLSKAPHAPMPKSLQPLPTNIISPIGGGDPELNKKLDQARKQGEQNRASGSETHSFTKF